MQGRLYSVIGMYTLLALSLACSHQTADPVSPTAVRTASSDASSGTDGSTLKVTAPTPTSPINNVVLESASATMVCTAATGTNITSKLVYDFELYDDQNVKIRTEVVDGTSWSVQGLEYARRYTWRVRGTASYVDAKNQTVPGYGPWSGSASFLTPENTGYIRGNELFDPLTNGQTVGQYNDVTFIPNVGVRLNSIESFVQYQLQTPLTQGEYSVTITNLSNTNEAWKSKVMSMLQGDGVNITDNAYRFTADRRNRDSGGTVRWTLRSRGVDAGEPVCGGASWSSTHLYLWTYGWNTGGSANLSVRDGGPTAPVFRGCGTSFRAPYSPNPHIIRLGSVGGRGGSESLPGATFRNVWVSSNPRPVLPGDTP